MTTESAGPVPTVRLAVTATALVSASTLPLYLTGSMTVLIGAEFGMDPTRVGGLTAAFFVVTALLGPLVGHLVERIGAARGALGGALLTVVALTGIGLLADSAVWLAAGLALGGLANTLASPSSSEALYYGVSPRRQGLAFAIKQSSVTLAGLLAGVAVPIIGVTIGWRGAFLLAAVSAAAVALGLPRRSVRTAAGVVASSPKEARRPWGLGVVPLALGAALAGGGANLLATFYVATAVSRGVSVSIAGTMLAVGNGLAIATRLMAGLLVDRGFRNPMTVVVAMILVGSAGLAGFGGLPSITWFVVASVVAFAIGWGWTGLFVLAVVQHYPGRPAAATSITSSSMTGGAASMPILFGLVAEHSSLAHAWMLSSGLLVAGAALLFVWQQLA